MICLDYIHPDIADEVTERCDVFAVRFSILDEKLAKVSTELSGAPCYQAREWLSKEKLALEHTHRMLSAETRDLLTRVWAMAALCGAREVFQVEGLYSWDQGRVHGRYISESSAKEHAARDRAYGRTVRKVAVAP